MQANILKGKIVAAGYTQRSLSKKLDMSENTLSSKLNGKSAFTMDEVIHLCDLLSIVDNEEKAYIFLS